MKGTVKSKCDVERLFQQGRRSSSYLMTVMSVPSSDENAQGRCAFIAGKKLGVAPLRSRCKRVMRACAAELGAPFEGYDVAFLARSQIAPADHGKVVHDMRKLLSKLGMETGR